MAGNLSDYAEKKALDHSLGKSAWTMPTIYVGLFTAAPSDAGGGTEVTGGSYTRATTSAATWNAAGASGSTNALDINFVTASANWGTITHVGLFDALSGGNLIWHGPLGANKTVDSGDTFKFPAGQLSISLD
jgi:hypothetical protein